MWLGTWSTFGFIKKKGETGLERGGSAQGATGKKVATGSKDETTLG